MTATANAIPTETERKPLEYYLGLEYPFHVIADPDGGYVIVFPDLPGCLTQVDDLSELPFMVNDVRQLWIETEYEDGATIPLPSYPEEHSGKFNLRVPRSLHRRLAESAEREGVSLNQYVVGLLSEQDALTRVERRLDALEARSAPEAETESQPQPQPELATATT
jgi:predicted RNase H-like HicB family nuclease